VDVAEDFTQVVGQGRMAVPVGINLDSDGAASHAG
jgi:hypothetical protein